jgi:hypothetical protein
MKLPFILGFFFMLTGIVASFLLENNFDALSAAFVIIGGCFMYSRLGSAGDI